MIKDFSSQEEEQQYVIEVNLNRRHLNTWQKLMCYQSLIEYWQNRVKKMKKDNVYANKLKSIGEKVPYAQPVGSIAEKFNTSLGISLSEMQNALYIYKRRVKHPILVQRLENGNLTINQAKKLIDGRELVRNGGSKKYSEIHLQCPHCNSIATKDKYKRVLHG